MNSTLICLLLGYRGKYAFGDHGEIHGILSRIRDKILRIRGPLALARLAAVPEIRFAPKRDKWLTALWLTAAALVLLTIALFAVYTLTLGSGLGSIQAVALIMLPLSRRPRVPHVRTPTTGCPIFATASSLLRWAGPPRDTADATTRRTA